MRLLPSVIITLATAAQFGEPVFAHHSQAMFDTSQEILNKVHGSPESGDMGSLAKGRSTQCSGSQT
ncbi:MAG: hypothetical protein P8M72_06025 [Gammaproteobacteria bacterium]|nr:hypothetical protein [Gammaproteobacteria bacterium]